MRVPVFHSTETGIETSTQVVEAIAKVVEAIAKDVDSIKDSLSLVDWREVHEVGTS